MSSENEQTFPFGILGIDDPDTATRKQVKSAYARKLKTIDQAKDAEAFQELREALEYALHLVQLRESMPDMSVEGEAPVSPEKDTDSGDGVLAVEPEPESGLPADAEVPVSEILAAVQLDNELALEGPVSEGLLGKLADIGNLPAGHTAIRKISELLDDPDFTDFEANRLLGLEIAGFLERAIEWRDDDTPRLAPEITAAFLHVLDERYHWLTDYRALEAYTHQPELLHTAMYLKINGYVAMENVAAGGPEKMAPIDSTMGIAVLISFFGGMIVRILEPGSLAQVVLGWIVTVAVVIVFAILAYKIVGKFAVALYRRARDLFSRF